MNTRLFTALSLVVLLGFVALTLFNAVRERQRIRSFIADHELPAIGMAVSANLDRTAAKYQQVGHELLRGDFLRDWIFGGEEDEEELRAFLEGIRARHGMMDAGIVSDRSETYYGTDGRTVGMSRDNWERDGWYYLYRETMPEANIDTWYFPETGRIGMWVNVSIRDADGSFLGITGGGVEATEFSRVLHSYGELPGINVFLARSDGQLVYASNRNLLKRPGCIDDVSTVAITEEVDGTEGIAGRRFMPDGPTGSLLWARYSKPWDTFIVIEKTGDIVNERIREMSIRTLVGGGVLTASLYALTLTVILAARKRIASQTRKLETIAGEDALTGLYNRLSFTEYVEREVSLIRRSGGQSCVALLDLDYFKNVNDTYGHPTGDAVLQAVAGVIRSELRDTDIPARFGGEEFAVLLPSTSIDGAAHLAERIRRAVAAGFGPFPELPALPTLTISIGVTSLIADDSGPDSAYHRADDALYRAKRNGRDRVECGV